MLSISYLNGKINIELRNTATYLGVDGSLHLGYDHPQEFQASLDFLVVPNIDSSDFVSLGFTFNDKSHQDKSHTTIMSIMKKDATTLVFQFRLASGEPLSFNITGAHEIIEKLGKLIPRFAEAYIKSAEYIDATTQQNRIQELLTKFASLIKPFEIPGEDKNNRMSIIENIFKRLQEELDNCNKIISANVNKKMTAPRKIYRWGEKFLPDDDEISVEQMYTAYQADAKDTIICAVLNGRVIMGIPLQGNEKKPFNKVVIEIHHDLINKRRISEENFVHHYEYLPEKHCVNYEEISCAATSIQLKKYLDQSLPQSSGNSSSRLFKFRCKEFESEIAAKKSLVDAHLNVMREIKANVRRR